MVRAIMRSISARLNFETTLDSVKNQISAKIAWYGKESLQIVE